jgi:hypothetical protein
MTLSPIWFVDTNGMQRQIGMGTVRKQLAQIRSWPRVVFCAIFRRRLVNLMSLRELMAQLA